MSKFRAFGFLGNQSLKVSDHLHGDESLLGATFECCVLFDIGIKGCLVSKIGINRI